MSNVNKAKDQLEEILNNQEYTVYTDQKRNFFTVLWEKVKAWLVEQLDRLFPSLEKTSMLAGPILMMIIIGMLILIAVGLFFFIRNRNRKRMYYSKTPLHSMKEIDWSYRMHLTEANKQEEISNLTLATRHLFLALLLYFHENEWLEARLWKTNWEYYEELKKVNRQSADEFYHLANFFDEVTYGEQDVQKDEYVQFRTKVMNVLGDTVE